MSKLQRTVVKLEKELQAATKDRAGKTSMSDLRVMKYSQPLVYLAIVFLFWGQPVAWIPSRTLFPLSLGLSVGAPSNYVGVLPWCIICHVILSEGVPAIARQLGWLPPQPTTASTAMSMLSSVLGMKQD